ncbi:hypothetical protein CTAYLR_009860 [Chrysophaeum taylorii]|uniref:CW-type domain-containing protein n=1 Tax=Chrysophaeum taylorii TaxID=2483200 RepID=A0AAD7XHW6_9STRA|nr:hypothetical protein CTAYLR_009860 [Chrysophaeum taylorii]
MASSSSSSSSRGKETDPEIRALARALKDVASAIGGAPSPVLPWKNGPRSLAEVSRLAQDGGYCRDEAELVEGARLGFREACAARAEDVGMPYDDEARLAMGRRVSRLRWDDILRDARAVVDASYGPEGAMDPVRRCAERCWVSAGFTATKAAAQRVMAENREPFAHRGARKPTAEPRRYRTIDDYVTREGAEPGEAARVARALRVQGVPAGIVRASYDVDDEAFGERFRARFGVASCGARTHVHAVLDRLCDDVFARACRSQTPLALGVDVEEVAVFGCDPFTRRAVEISVEYAGLPLPKADFARAKLVPRLFFVAEEKDAGGRKKKPSSVVAAALDLAASPNATRSERSACAAVVSMARWLQSEAPFRARPKGAGVIALRDLEAHEYVCDYLGEVYPPARWLEKLAATTAARRRAFGARRADATTPPEAFHNIALERPASDPRGYAMFFVDAGGSRANFASSLSHSCDGNVASSTLVKADGRLSVALHTTRRVAKGEELAFDYSACTSSEAEWRQAVCLCGAPACRGSYVELVNLDELQQCLARGHGALDAFAMLLRASSTTGEGVEERAVLARHGLGDAFFDRDDDDIQATTTPLWLEKYVAALVEFIEFERGQLPFALLRAAETDDPQTRARAALRARLVLEQRIQALTCAVSVTTVVSRLRSSSSSSSSLEELSRRAEAPTQPPPLAAVLAAEPAIAALRSVLDRLGDVARRLSKFTPAMRRKFAADPERARTLLVDLAAVVAATPTARGTKARCRAALLDLRTELLAFVEERRAPLPPKEEEEEEEVLPPEEKKKKKKKKKRRPNTKRRRVEDEILGCASACADAVLLVAHTNTLVRPRVDERRPVVASPTIPVRARDIGGGAGADLADEDFTNPTLARLRKATDPDDVVASPARRYGPFAELEALLGWHDLDLLAEPGLGDGEIARAKLVGCGLLPDPAAVLARLADARDDENLLVSGETIPYEPEGRLALARLASDPAARARPWSGVLRAAFFPGLRDDDHHQEATSCCWKHHRTKPRRLWSTETVDFLGSPALDALLGDFGGIDAVVRALGSSDASSLRTSTSSAEATVHALADALPDRPPSRWVACDRCDKWRVVPWTAARGFDENAPFFCEDQEAWGVPPDEANCDTPEPSWGEDDVVVDNSKIDLDATVGTKCDALCVKTNVWFDAKIVDETFDSPPTKRRKTPQGEPGRKLRVHFTRWAAKFDEWFHMPRDAFRLAPHRTYSAVNATAQRAAKGRRPEATTNKRRRRR